MLNVFFLAVVLAHLTNSNGFAITSECHVSINNDLSDPQPLLLRPEGGAGNAAFYLPQRFDVISFTNGQVIQLLCLGGNIRIDGTSLGTNALEASCVAGTRFAVTNQTVPFSSITCSRYPVHTARLSGRTCLSKHREFEIGFVIGQRFVKLLTGCFDDSAQTTIYTLFQMPAAIGGFQRGFPRPSWIEGDFFNLGPKSLNTLYTRIRQRITINGLLGLPENSTKYIHETNNFFLARGHLAAKADFVFGAQQRLTFYFLNAVPHWQTFNGANWMVLERDCRNYASSRGLNLWVYTGTYGVTTLPHSVTGKDVELHLFVDENNNRAIPVPQLFWKVLYEPITRAGVVFLGVNNPYHEDVSRHIICPDVCDRINWLTWSANNIQRGYSYCCTVDDFRKAVKTLPDFDVDSLLV